MNPAVVAAALSGAASFLGGERRNEAQLEATQMANAASLASTREQMNFQREMSNSAYQRAVADMRQAGINPMLASRVGGASTPGGSSYQAQIPSIMDTLTPGIQAGMGVLTGSASAQQAEAGAELSTAQLRQVDATVDKIKEETKNIPIEGDRLKATISLLVQQTDLYFQQQLTEAQRFEMVKETVSKLKEETSLLKLDVEAAKMLDNIGREYKQLQPIIELLRSFIGRR
jgi:hypothetical protein